MYEINKYKTLINTGYEKFKDVDKSQAYNFNLRENTLRYAYLSHFIRPNQFSEIIQPVLVYNWLTKTRTIAISWAEEHNYKVVNGLVAQIDAEVDRFNNRKVV